MCPDIMKFITGDQSEDESSNGHLLDLDDWSEDKALSIAQGEGIEMTDDHWEIIHALRQHYDEFGLTPNIRVLAKVLVKKLGPEKGSQKRLYALFPKGPSYQGCLISGLPVPRDCLDMPG